MFTKLKTAALSAMIGLGTLAAIPAAAQAEGLYLNYGTGHRSGVGIGVQVGDYDRYDYRDYRHDRRTSNLPGFTFATDAVVVQVGLGWFGGAAR